MTEGAVIWFLVTTFWVPATGEFRVMGGGRFASQTECEAMQRAEQKAKGDLPGLKVECRSGAPKPRGLPEAQPHVPTKIDA